MMDAQGAAAHYPTEGLDTLETTALVPAPNVDAPPAGASLAPDIGNSWRNTFRKAQLEKKMEGYKASGFAPYNPYQQQPQPKVDEDGLPVTSMKL